jgi:hypothetical protein
MNILKAASTPHLSSSSDSDIILEALEAASTRADIRNLMDKFGYDNVAPLWNKISPVQQGALMLVRNFDQAAIIHGLDDTSN